MFIKNYSNEVDELKFHYLANISCDLVEAKSIYQYIYIYINILLIIYSINIK